MFKIVLYNSLLHERAFFQVFFFYVGKGKTQNESKIQNKKMHKNGSNKLYFSLHTGKGK